MSLAVLSSLLSLLLIVQPSIQQDEFTLVKRFPYMNWAVVRTLNDPRAMQAMNVREDRDKRAPWDLFENTDSKRTSLKRLAILSARGFGR